MSKIETYNNPLNKLTTVTAEFGDERDINDLMDAVKDRIVIKLVDKFVEAHGEEILASIDLETIKKKTNDKVVVSALKELIKWPPPTK